jgi:FKBP-type peptidyl-prolyl cis-trans isomerase
VGIVTRRASVPQLEGIQLRSLNFRDVAQSGSALQWGCRGRGFKSRRPDSARPRSDQSVISHQTSEFSLHRLLVLLSAGALACGGDTKSKGDQASAAFSASLEVDTTALTKTPSGLRYQDVTEGQGTEATADKSVSVHYTGWLPNGEKFDSSRDRNEPFSFTLGAGQVIAGWDEGVAGMKVGGRRKLVIPADLGYGTAGAPLAIPPGATLVFDVELLDVR